MWMCRQVAKALAEQDYESLPPLRRWGLRLHVKLCVMCGKFHKQVMIMQDGVRTFRREEESLDGEGDGMTEASKKKLSEAVNRASGSDIPPG